MDAVVAVTALFTFIVALQAMRRGLSGLMNSRLPDVISRLVRTPGRGIATGTLATALVQSSAAVTAITVGMVASGSMVFRDALGVVLGSNVGSTVTPQLLIIRVGVAAYVGVVAGVLLMLNRQPIVKHSGLAIAGFSCIFIALEALESSLHPLSQGPWFHRWIEAAGQHPVYAVVVGALASAMVQSSTMVTVITMALADQGLIALPGGIALVLGANVGTCLTSVIAAIGQNRAAQQVALSHVLLNVFGVCVFMPILSPFADLVGVVSGSSGAGIANAHTLFNLICTLLAWPLIAPFARLVERLLPNQTSA